MYLQNTPLPVLPGEPQLALLRPFQTPVLRASLWQVISTFGLYLACVAAMYASLKISVWLTLALALPAGGLILRIFMLQHDCGHQSLFRTRRLNAAVGSLCSLVTLTPFAYWRRLHARHHGSWNNLDARGIPADFFSDCITVAEFAAMSRAQKAFYKLSHHPLLMHLVLPPVIFILLYRVPFDTPASCRRERRSVLLLDLALAAVYTGLILAFGFKSVLLVQLPAMVLAAITGIWLFSVQHRFEGAQWRRRADWSFAEASLHGSSHLRLPRVLQWFSGNIGLHHVHHLAPGIPNYLLQPCHDALPQMMAPVTTLGLRAAFGAAHFALWDEETLRMVPFPG